MNIHLEHILRCIFMSKAIGSNANITNINYLRGSLHAVCCIMLLKLHR